jgi:arabinose-5-phosphate isomerase
MQQHADGAGTDAEAVRATARRVLTIEAEALAALAAGLPPDFAPAVELIAAAQGRVVLSGIGKSGHVARKIAATLSSTGTPSLYVHPAEASHGDLGMVTPGDICILMSNSGETAELSDLIAHTRRFAIPLVAVTAAAGSTLARASDRVLLLPPAPEACAIGMAPTTSTTMAMALGDALAVAVMERRGFRPEHFRALHPGGRLGARLARVGEIMRRPPDLPLVSPATPMAETLIVMTAKGAGVAGVAAQDGRLVGIITDGDLRRNIAGLMERTAGEVATPGPVTVAADALAAAAVALMQARRIQVLFVLDAEGRPEGLLHIQDCLRAGVA